MRMIRFLVPGATVLALAACATAPDTSSSRAEVSYGCESGATVLASYPDTDHARIQYQGRSHTLAIAVSASGARYVGEGIEWWTKGSGPGSSGSLFAHLSDGTSGELLESCTAR